MAAPTGRLRNARKLAVDGARFSAGWRLVPDRIIDLDRLTLPPGIPKPTISIDVIRPLDLVALTFVGFNLELIGGDEPVLRPAGGADGHLVVRLAYQHLGERALYEGLAPVPNESDPANPPTNDAPPTPIDGVAARPVAPIQALPARGSRVVLKVAAGREIPFSTAGLLAAMERFPMAVHPLATPRPGAIALPGGGPIFHLPGGVIALIGSAGVVLSRATRQNKPPDPTTAAGMVAINRDMRRVRELLVRETGHAVRLDGTASVRLNGAKAIVPDPRVKVRPRARFSRDAEPLETAIEAPFRLVISPSDRGGWTHAHEPVGAEGAPHRVELWHSRLGVRHDPDASDGGGVDDRSGPQRIVRAIWARDRERFPGWQTVAGGPIHDDSPFRMSLDGADRHMLVRQSAETWLGRRGSLLTPSPVDVEALWLSALGAWLDLHGGWTTLPYSAAGLPSVLKWDHVAPMGRDQHVRVVYPGYLYPLGHRATLVKLTERKMKDVSPSVAGLYQRKFLEVGEPVRRYDQRNFPFQEVRLDPLVTPTLSPDPGLAQDSFFFPSVDGKPFSFVLHCIDKEGRKVKLNAPLMWVAEHFAEPAIPGAFGQVENGYRTALANAQLVSADGQDIAFAPVASGGDTVLPTEQLTFEGAAQLGTSVPRLDRAKVRIKAAEHMAPLDAQTIEYVPTYLTHGFGGAQNPGEVWAQIVGPIPRLAFGGADAPSDRSGGFITPDLSIAGLSRIKGTVGDVAGTATGGFDPVAFLGAAAPKLFGLVKLTDLLSLVGLDLDDAPDFVSEALDRVEGFMADLARAKAAVDDAIADAQQRLTRAQQNGVALIADGRQALADELEAKAQAALDAATGLHAAVVGAVDQVLAAIASVPEALSEGDVAAALTAPLAALSAVASTMRTTADQLPPLVANRIRQLADVLAQVAGAADIITDIFAFVNGLASSVIEGRFRYEWRPKLANWPAGPDPILEVPERGLVLAVEGRVAGKSPAKVEVLAELRDFSLNLLPGETLVRFRFDHISFKAGSSGKAEVDVVMNDIEFVGLLGFVETLKELIPFDGFADPPYVDVSPSGLVAGFTLALPNVAIGVFSLSNISLGADVQVPFLGDVVTVGFNFCTRERPFTLAVLFIGGGGWFLIRLSPDGLDVLELGLEAGATLSVDFGVASGSISAMIGLYMRLEGDAGSLTAYFRLRGEVDVLGLISASIELYLALTYDFDTGKMVGKAKISVKVEVFFLSFSVSIECERQFAGSNGDPTFAEVMGVQPDVTSNAWSDYCLAFAGA